MKNLEDTLYSMLESRKIQAIIERQVRKLADDDSLQFVWHNGEENKFGQPVYGFDIERILDFELEETENDGWYVMRSSIEPDKTCITTTFDPGEFLDGIDYEIGTEDDLLNEILEYLNIGKYWEFFENI